MLNLHDLNLPEFAVYFCFKPDRRITERATVKMNRFQSPFNPAMEESFLCFFVLGVYMVCI